MTVRILTQAPDPDLAWALEDFERQFTYPLGAGHHFRISHGADYPRFFRAIAPDASACFVATGGDAEVRGTLGVAVRPLRFPGGETRLAAYLGDLKTAPGPGRGRTLFRLTKEATAWSLAQGAVVAYGVVMEGGSYAPSDYTGRFGMHAFRAIQRICILRIPVKPSASSGNPRFEAEPGRLEECFCALSTGVFAPLGGRPDLRSSTPLTFLLVPDQDACGVLEDTRLAKQLFREDGEEMLAAHLSKFAYSNPRAGVDLIREALIRCAGIAPAMFVAIPFNDLKEFRELLGAAEGLLEAPATIYGTEFGEAGQRWNISTSEI